MQANKPRNEQIAKLYRKDSKKYSYRKLSRMFKISHQRVHQIITVAKTIPPKDGSM